MLMVKNWLIKDTSFLHHIFLDSDRLVGTKYITEQHTYHYNGIKKIHNSTIRYIEGEQLLIEQTASKTYLQLITSKSLL